MITVVTGLPGAAKTLYSLCMVKTLAERDKRPVFYSGIADLKLPWSELGDIAKLAERYVDDEGHAAFRFNLPANSIIVIDEAQRVYRPRANGASVPPHVAALETHRHDGVDIVLITQHPKLVDANVRRLTGRHLHAVRNFGLQRSTIHEWGEIKDDPSARADSVRHEFAFPRDAFGWYKSAEVHTVKRNIPMRVVVLLVLPVVIVGAIAFAWSRLSGRPAGSPAAVAGVSQVSGGSIGRAKTAAEFVAERKPLLNDFPESAPIYAAMATPKVFPVVAGCLRSAKRCVCYTQQGTRLAGVSGEFCNAYVERGAFDPYRLDLPADVRSGGMGRDTPHAEPQRSPSAAVAIPTGALASGTVPVAAEQAVNPSQSRHVPDSSPWRYR